MTLNAIRTSGFWIVCANSAIRKFIHCYVLCRSLGRKFGKQKMAKLPFDRLQEEPQLLIVGFICLNLSLSAVNKRNQNAMESCSHVSVAVLFI